MPTEIVMYLDPNAPLYDFKDIDGDGIAVFTAEIPGVGKGVNIRTSKAGCSVPATEIPTLIAALNDRLAEIGTR
ncbi:hypothetical protein ACIQGZ_17215 [Streptomyces sp. NPDC092296]|uniref:hypothetical protein n=1 Tax=Streptomyces sp. NPDC092296 TaxID=3366012 RepID=UPI0037F2E3A8